MKKLKISLMVAVIAVAGYFIIAADHIDAPAVTGATTDITDFYAFEAEDSDNLVLVANVQGLLSPEDTKSAMFDENVMIEINIDNSSPADNIEDLVIQAFPKDGKMFFVGPVAPSMTGLESKIEAEPDTSVDFVKISELGKRAKVKKTSEGLKLFAGPRDDPFFFDFVRYTQILTPGDDDMDGEEETSFNDPGDDTFAGTNVLSIVVEVPKSLVGDGAINAWVETKRKQ